MLRDIKSNIAMLAGHVPASRNGASLVGSTIVNIGDYLSAAFMLSIGAVTTGGSLAAKLQYSSSSTFATDINDDDGSTGNSAPVTGLTTANSVTRMNISLPFDETKPYYRLAVTDAGAAVVYGSEFIGLAKVTPVAYS